MIDEVGALMREAAARAILPAYRRLGADDVTEKAPGEVVTVADRQAERILTDGLTRLLPDSQVVGEEGVADDPATLARLDLPGPVWLVDPLDGTANFASGREPFAVMVALRRDGVTEASWILDPMADRLTVARAGVGAYADGVELRAPAGAPPVAALRGVLPTRFLPPPVRAAVQARAARLGEVLAGHHCAGREYPDIVAGIQHFALFWRTLPWDHAPGALLVGETGGVARRLDGSPYQPADGRAGLLVAANEEIWHTVRETLFSGVDPTAPPDGVVGGDGPAPDSVG
ncbi:inositol monophosphatase family protein [Solwaraspora sp. WMMD1047]|uniref:inositol monophosphatase family protein n=1 Tax=Solwaraspora sp. WMMD1047 TaxID=3016102 RepID=UPI002417BED5|nr:inositol monophosphatase family protein [Solwaraspora sp. WMMD1047]MDG4828337.1 inositol monophosphatase family protein [Solwaraspora sp. WMMD1047]